MARCLELGRLGEGRTAPNPMVGAVVVRDGEVVGEGWHERAGAPHAEIVALDAARDRARGATLYVNLEPCCHWGRTPPCVDAILRAGVARVVAGMVDPNPLVNGRGIAALEAGGVTVEVGVLEEACRALNAGFLLAITAGRPRIVLKAATTLDGRIATESGESRWITGEEARRHGHRMRDLHDAVLVGSGTVLADDPRLDCRIPGGRDPVPVVLDTHLGVPATARVFQRGRGTLVYATRLPAASDHPATVVRVPEGPSGVDLGSVLHDLVERGVHTVLVEGGGRVHRSFLEARLADRVLLYLAPKILAGGPSWVAGPGVDDLASAWGLKVAGVERLGSDLLIDLER
ncbi:MAG: bifunctional diaminohydroxyphosphoribosylaminopyrimidine deaminase/5-amino-6-(5-phosphoribosylamino)uracil reductase RibD [Deltaproteobacteria bacterium]|nr:bifunctional diaminohydroxyphosphoribosylaminopyrimidine deaminase/5-amino-6-(5-phosphoribosylamino)uracil reductase RibD [Deltaproteobacteria bacterium]